MITPVGIVDNQAFAPLAPLGELRELRRAVDQVLPSNVKQVDFDLLTEVSRSLEFSPELVAYLSRFSDSCYTRTIIHEQESFQMLILCWQANQVSPIHNHKGSHCAVKVLQGKATEIVFQKGATGLYFPSGSSTMNEGEVTVSSDEDTHQMGNFENRNLITCHIYSPPLREMEVFDIDRSVFGRTYQNSLEKARAQPTERCEQ